MKPLRILATAYDYRPKLGGVATCSFELFAALARQENVQLLVMARAQAGDRAFDSHGLFETRRLALPHEAAMSIPALSASLMRESLRFRPHAVLNMLWMPGGVASLLSSPLRGCPYFVFAHGVEVLESRRNFRKKVRKALFSPLKARVYGNAASIFAVSRYTADRVIENCDVAPEHVRVARNGVDPFAFSPADPAAHETTSAAGILERHGLRGKRIFLTVTRLESYKGVDRCISAFRRVAALDPDARYVICGTGPDRPRLEALARHYRVADRVIFVGAVVHGDLLSWYRASHCFVLMTREALEEPNVEGFGLVFLEAAACEVPSIGGRSGGIPDAVVEGETGWLVDPHDDAAIANAMIESLRSAEETRRRGINARQRVLRELTWDHMGRFVLEEIRKHVRN